MHFGVQCGSSTYHLGYRAGTPNKCRWVSQLSEQQSRDLRIWISTWRLPKWRPRSFQSRSHTMSCQMWTSCHKERRDRWRTAKANQKCRLPKTWHTLRAAEHLHLLGKERRQLAHDKSMDRKGWKLHTSKVNGATAANLEALHEEALAQIWWKHLCCRTTNQWLCKWMPGQSQKHKSLCPWVQVCLSQPTLKVTSWAFFVHQESIRKSWLILKSNEFSCFSCGRMLCCLGRF